MNYHGSYRRLLDNAKAAMVAAIEIYNKPHFDYRDECVVILLLNAWELILKATLSKRGTSIFYPKKRKQPYRTLSWQDALSKCQQFFPRSVHRLPVQRNLELLATYRDNAVHFYNAKDFRVLLYTLVQTCVKNFRDFLFDVFQQRLEDEINWQLLPLGIQPPIDVMAYLSDNGTLGPRKGAAVRQFMGQLARATDDVTRAGADRGRLMTIFSIKLESVKRIGDADAVVGVSKAGDTSGPLAIVRTQDPNVTHPLRQKEVLNTISTLHGKRFTKNTFQALVWKHQLKEKSQYCWIASEGVLTRYSNDVVSLIKSLSPADVDAALIDYRSYRQAQTRVRERAA